MHSCVVIIPTFHARQSLGVVERFELLAPANNLPFVATDSPWHPYLIHTSPDFCARFRFC